MQKISLSKEATSGALIQASFDLRKQHVKRQQNINLKTYSKDI